MFCYHLEKPFFESTACFQKNLQVARPVPSPVLFVDILPANVALRLLMLAAMEYIPALHISLG